MKVGTLLLSTIVGRKLAMRISTRTGLSGVASLQRLTLQMWVVVAWLLIQSDWTHSS